LDGKSFIIPIIQLPPTHYQPTILYMSFDNVTNFQEFMGAGREGAYSSDKENNKGRIVAFWLSVPTNAIIL